MEPRIEPDPSKVRQAFTFDEPAAVALIVLGSLAFILAVRRGFRGLVVTA